MGGWILRRRRVVQCRRRLRPRRIRSGRPRASRAIRWGCRSWEHPRAILVPETGILREITTVPIPRVRRREMRGDRSGDVGLPRVKQETPGAPRVFEGRHRLDPPAPTGTDHPRDAGLGRRILRRRRLLQLHSVERLADRIDRADGTREAGQVQTGNRARKGVRPVRAAADPRRGKDRALPVQDQRVRTRPGAPCDAVALADDHPSGSRRSGPSRAPVSRVISGGVSMATRGASMSRAVPIACESIGGCIERARSSSPPFHTMQTQPRDNCPLDSYLIPQVPTSSRSAARAPAWRGTAGGRPG